MAKPEGLRAKPPPTLGEGRPSPRPSETPLPPGRASGTPDHTLVSAEDTALEGTVVQGK